MLYLRHKGIRKLRGELYRKMIELAIEFSDAVMLVFDGEVPEKTREMRATLAPYLLHTRNDGACTPENPDFEWPGTIRSYIGSMDSAEQQCSSDSLTYVDTYELSDIVKDVIISADAFTDWWPRRNATDIAFFKDGECWLGTTVHEYTMWIEDHEWFFSQIFDEWDIEYRFMRSREKFREPYVLNQKPRGNISDEGAFE